MHKQDILYEPKLVGWHLKLVAIDTTRSAISLRNPDDKVSKVITNQHTDAASN